MKKLVLIFFVLCFSIFNLKAQGVWTPRDTLPDSAMVQGIPGFSIGNYGYAGLGDTYYAGHPSDELFQFDPSNNSWARKANFPGRARVAPACFVICDKAYLVTGSVSNGGACITECWEYDATTNIWTQKANFPGSARTYAVGFAIDSLGYVGTGANELTDFRKDFYAYHPSTDTWKRIADFPGIARSAACGFATNGKGYVCFGQDSLVNPYWLNGDMWQYDPGIDSWTQKSNCPDSLAYYAASGFTICNNIYVGTGLDSINGASTFIWKYNTLTDIWTQVASVPGTVKIQGAAFAIADSGYYGFGVAWDSGLVDLNVFDKYFGGDTCQTTDNCNITTGDSKVNTLLEDISLYPNPFKDACTIKLPDIFNDLPIFSLYNMEGLQQKTEMHGDGIYYNLNRNNLPNGVYILTVKYADHIYNKKLVIIN